eukprot:SAG31_NODE_28931_length_403_cov_0.986842_1_plen_83_part_01
MRTGFGMLRVQVRDPPQSDVAKLDCGVAERSNGTSALTEQLLLQTTNLKGQSEAVASTPAAPEIEQAGSTHSQQKQNLAAQLH